MSARSQAQCTPSCARYRSPLSPENVSGLERPFCAAFPDGIPANIWDNLFDHRQPHEGDRDLQWVSRDGAAFPTYAFGPGILGEVIGGEGASPLTAAADAGGGAMIALVPSPADIERLVIEGGEAADQLHLTLLYLGDAVDVDEETRAELIAWANDMVEGWPTAIRGDAFASALFNPTGDEPCVVVLISGDEVAEFHETVVADITEMITVPEQHQPWYAHVTLAYVVGLPAVGQVLEGDRMGPVTFDRLRLAFGGEVTDVPIGRPAAAQTPGRKPEEATVEEAPEVLPVPSESSTVASATPLFEQLATQGYRTAFDGCLRCYGPAHDGPCPPAL